MIKLALPLFNDDLAPRFCYAHHMLLVEVEQGVVTSTRSIPMGPNSGSERLGYLSTIGVSELLCGGFNREFLPRAIAVGIRVQWGLAGNALEVADAYCRGDLDSCRVCHGGPVIGLSRSRRGEEKDVT